MQHDRQHIHQRADALYEQYGRPFESDHWGEYIVIAPDGRTVLAATLVEAAQAASSSLGQGNFAFKIGEPSVATCK